MASSDWNLTSWKLLEMGGASLRRVLLYGPPGTGKSRAAMRMGVSRGTPVYRINLTEETPAAELRGHYIPEGPIWNWHDGPALSAYRNGGRLVLDEITRASDDALSFTLALLDDPETSKITLPNGEHVLPHKDFSCWATTNDGPKSLTDALADRFVVRVECDQVHPDALKMLPTALAKAVTEHFSGRQGVSLRSALEFIRLTSDENMKESIAAQLLWGKAGRDTLNSLNVAAAAAKTPAPSKIDLDDLEKLILSKPR